MLAEQVRQRLPSETVEIAYLELAEPTIPQAALRCIEGGADRVRMFPYFLSPGVHVSRDLEQYRLQFSREYPDVKFQLCPPMGQHPGIVDIVIDRLADPGGTGGVG
jgi:sirohydrochlorin ferrochelatase